MKIVRADTLPHRHNMEIVERDDKGRIKKGYPVGVKKAEPGCAQHTHVTLTDKRRWCYDDGELIELG